MSSENIGTVKMFYEILMGGDMGKLPTIMDQDIELVMMKGWLYGGTFQMVS